MITGIEVFDMTPGRRTNDDNDCTERELQFSNDITEIKTTLKYIVEKIDERDERCEECEKRIGRLEKFGILIAAGAGGASAYLKGLLGL